jgi:PAS domain S-box-containing protein
VLLPEAFGERHKFHREQYAKHPTTRPMGVDLRLEGRRRDGSCFPVEISLSPVYSGEESRVIAIVRDISERIKAEEGRRIAEQRYRAMIEAVKDYGIFALDPDGTISSWNAGAERIKQYTAEEVIGRPFSIFYLPEDRPIKAARGLEIARETGRFEEEGWRVRKDGTEFWASVVITAVRSPAGEIVGFSKVTRDLTERRDAEERFRVMQEDYIGRLEASKKLADRANQLKTEFLVNMSHELRSPLQTVIGFAELLSEEMSGPLNETQQRFIEHVHRGAMHLLELINDLLDLGRIEAGRLNLKIDELQTDAAIEEALSLIRQRAVGKSIELASNVSSAISIAADRLRFRQILNNLLTNAIKFTPEGGRIRVEAVRRDNGVEISVSDTGIGIPEEEQGMIFDKFYQISLAGRRQNQGSGLGLAITKGLVEQHGGKLWLESKPGEGSRFIFTIPAFYPDVIDLSILPG